MIINLFALLYCAAMIYGFFSALKTLFKPLTGLTEKINSAAQEIKKARQENRPVNGTQFNNSPLEKKWSLFVKDWNNNLIPDTQSSTINPDDYFDFNDMISRVTNPMHIHSLPSIMTGLGLLGTFSGLVLGISNLDLNTAHNLLDGIKTLLGGTRLAFSTSLTGLLLALIWGHIHRTKIHDFNISCYNFIDEIRSLFPCSNHEHILVKIYDIISKEAHKNNTVLRPAAQKLLTVSENFLSEARESNLKTLAALAEQFVMALNKNMKNKFMEMADFLENLEKWNQKTRDEFSVMIKKMDIITDKFIDISDENTHISKLHAQYLSNMSQAMNNAQNGQEKINSHMKDSAQYLTKTLDMVEKYNRSMILALEKIEASNQRLSDTETINIDLIRDTWTSITKNLDSAISSAFVPIEKNIALLDEHFKKAQTLTMSKEKDIKDLADVLKLAGKEFSDSIDTGVEKYFENFDSNIDDICKKIALMALETTKASQELIDSIKKMKDSLEEQNISLDKKLNMIANIKTPGLLERLGLTGKKIDHK